MIRGYFDTLRNVGFKVHRYSNKEIGKLRGYDKMKGVHYQGTIGLLLCKDKNEVLPEYALKGYNEPMGISDYQISKAIPDELKSSLPDISDLENELSKEGTD